MTATLGIGEQETARFGAKCCRADRATLVDLPVILDFCQTEKVRLLTLRCDVSELTLVHVLEAAGFKLMDTLVYTGADLTKSLHQPQLAELEYRLAGPCDRTAVGDVAALAFRHYYSHYHADDRLCREDADGVYRDWAERSCDLGEGHADAVFLALDGGLVGFGTVRATGRGAADAPLFGVLPRARGRGIFSSLLWKAVEWARDMGFAQLTYSTQIQNRAALRTVTKMGFQFERASYTFHKWWDG